MDENATVEYFDVVVVGGTPAGLTAALAAARRGCRVVVLERTHVPGGLPANGLGATDLQTRGATGGLFLRFVERLHQHYRETYGEHSEQARVCSEGYHFEPSVAAAIWQEFLAAEPLITVRTERQFDAFPRHVERTGARLTAITVTVRPTGASECYTAGVFIDATYEGDLAGAAGASYRLGRESFAEYREPCAGVIYKPWNGEPDAASTGAGDDRIQAYNYRLCLTREPKNRLPFVRPEHYDRREYLSVIEDLFQNRRAGAVGREFEPAGIGFLTNIVLLPNGKTDANNQHLAFLSTDLPEENQAWPTADWAWRDDFAARLRSYIEGLFWFASQDAGVPAAFREQVAAWGWAADEYTDNGGFPRQVYVREGRRLDGRHRFTAHDALPLGVGRRPPVHADSVTASHYALDSHAIRKREPGRCHLEGFFSWMTAPYTVPYGVMVPEQIDGLLVPVAASSTHVGFSTLRMEPCWMALGEAAGEAAALARETAREVRAVDVTALQERLLAEGGILIYTPGEELTTPAGQARQKARLAGGFYQGQELAPAL